MTLTPALRFLSNQVWAIHPPVFEAIAALFEARASDRTAGRVERADGSRGQEEPKPEIIGDTGVIPVRGVIARYADQINGECQDQGRSAESLQRDLLAMEHDPRVKRVVLRIDSPGGTVAGTSETADAIRRLSASGKPVTAFIDGMAASAAYWLASQADEIVMAGPTSEVGAIGVITARVDATRAQEARGFKVQVFRTSPLKAPGALGETLTREQAAAIDRYLADFHAVFAGAVQAGRGMTDAQVSAATTGEMWRPTQAIAMDLADRVATWEQVVGGSTPVQTPGAKRAGDLAAPGATPSTSAVGATAQAEAESTPPAAAGLEQESIMDAKILAALAVMSAAHPTQAEALAAEAAKPGATVATLEAFIAPIAAKAKDDAHAAEVADLKAKLAAAEKSRDEQKTRAEQAEAKAAHKVGAKDPGPDDQGDTAKPKATQAEIDKMTPTARARHFAAGGIVVG